VSRSRADIVREAVAAFAGHGVEAVMGYVSEEVVFQEDPAWLDGGTWHGRDGVRELFRQRLESTAIEPEIEELQEKGDRVLAIMRWAARGRGSGVEVELHPGLVYTFDGPLIARVDAFIDPDQARARFDR
jgi:ketosteroid isomerase-like protein